MILHKRNDALWRSMRSDCSKCSGLCCTALFFSKTDGFPKDKMAGEPCMNLQQDYRCKIHAQLEQKKMRGCIGYDCFGAGQQVTEHIYQGKTWRDLPEHSAEIFDVFTVVFQMHQIRYFLTEASLFTFIGPWKEEIEKLMDENIRNVNQPPQDILAIDIEESRGNANLVLKQVCHLLQKNVKRGSKSDPKDFLGKSFRGRNMSGMDFSTKLLIAADFSGCIFEGTIFLGADTRDTIFNDADLSEAAFLTQGQINTARGNRNTKIPTHLVHPVTWK